MKSVADIQRPKIGMHIRFRLGEGAGARHSEIVAGQVTGHAPMGICHLDNGETFEYARGDRIFYYGSRPKGAESDLTREHEGRLDIVQRHHYGRRLRFWRRAAGACLSLALLFALATLYLFFRIGGTLAALH